MHVARGGLGRWVGLADLGRRVPFWLRRPGPDGSGPRLAGSVAAGVFSRFDLETSANEFVEAHFRFALRLRASHRGLEGRLSFYHVSSHLGDEFLQRTGRQPISTSREGLELLLGARPLPGFRLYAGPGAVVRSTESLGTGTLRAGGEWELSTGGPGDAGGVRPYVAAELYSWEEVGWEPMLSAEAGLGLGGGRFRLALVAGSGPSRAEQFLREDETLWGLSLTLRP